ncbi:uncharacterized protein LOC135829129 [Sycon ciliatum]|uniref:uncharacterized protein LOC135829129 n=1 Tax=Sycon ciliatum TaxID=27933 RepID=UPI0031F645AA
MWKSGGEQWSAVSSRIVTARLLVAKRGDKLPGGAPPNVRRKFFDDLQRVVDSIPSRDVLVLLGDLNARVGSSTDYADSAVSRIDGMPGDERMWGCVLGQFGLGNCNQAGEELLSFSAANQLSVMNTWYKKRRSKRGTWTHPATRQVHLIDYVIMRTAHCCYCRDVGVVRGALCWTDHYMVRAKLVLDFVQRRSTVPKRRSYATHRLREPDTLLQYRESMEAACGGVAGGGQSVEETWKSLRDDITSVAERTLGHGRRRQPDWFLENRAALEPLIEAKRRAYERMLSAGNQTTRSGLRSAQRSVAKAVRGAKEQWIREVVGDAERAQRDGCVMWKCIRKLQRVDDGRRTVTHSAVYDGDGHLTDSPESLVTRWHAHFDRVLNIASQFSMHVIDNMPTAEPRHELDMAPTFEEVMAAMRRMSRGTAGGSSGIVPELVLGGGLALHRRIHSLISQIWAGGSVVSEWRDAEIVPIPKKGDLRSCDNWRGVSLLDVVGKMFARVIQDRLQELSKDVLPESQCGFRKGRGCVDMVFVARQLIEKAIEHDTPLYVIFVDLKKAYDSIPQTWAVKVTYVHRLTVVHRSCIRSILGVSRIQQWEDRLTSVELGRRFGMSLDISDLLRQHRLRWLGHIARMEELRTPQQMVFGELYATRPRHGPKKRWRDVVVTDLAAAQIGEGEWIRQAQDRPTWRRLCRQQPPPPGPKEFRCACGRSFGRIGDLKRHAPHCRV